MFGIMQTLAAPSVEEITGLADAYADRFLAALPLADDTIDLRAALSGTLLSFLSDVIQKAA